MMQGRRGAAQRCHTLCSDSCWQSAGSQHSVADTTQAEGERGVAKIVHVLRASWWGVVRTERPRRKPHAGGAPGHSHTHTHCCRLPLRISRGLWCRRRQRGGSSACLTHSQHPLECVWRGQQALVQAVQKRLRTTTKQQRAWCNAGTHSLVSSADGQERGPDYPPGRSVAHSGAAALHVC
jgi:hypothetical protein